MVAGVLVMLQKFNGCITGHQAGTKPMFMYIQTMKMFICSHCIPYKVMTNFNLRAPEFDDHSGMQQTAI